MPATTAPARPAAVSNDVATYITGCLKRSVAYAEQLVKDIPAEKFATSPHPTMNHPAFCLGHLSIYPDRIFMLIGRPELAREKPGFADLFKAGAECVQDPARYPAKDEIVGHFLDRYGRLLEVLPETPDEVFRRPNPIEGRMREIFPTVGIAANFLANNHTMMHLGQISAWHRAVGLPPAM